MENLLQPPLSHPLTDCMQQLCRAFGVDPAPHESQDMAVTAPIFRIHMPQSHSPATEGYRLPCKDIQDSTQVAAALPHGSRTCGDSSGFSRNHCNFASRPCQKQSGRSASQACQIPSKEEAASGGFSPLACKAIVCRLCVVGLQYGASASLRCPVASSQADLRDNTGCGGRFVFEHHRLRLAAHFFTFRDSVGTASAACSRFFWQRLTLSTGFWLATTSV